MPYKDKAKHREYYREYMRKRRKGITKEVKHDVIPDNKAMLYPKQYVIPKPSWFVRRVYKML